ncbi:MAG: L-aspartate oxidase [Bacteroidia bacterium]|nr:MAG: L-aspartate oxidase [Bacteroidia bacterium]
MKTRKVYTDFLIIGSGIAGLFYALKVAHKGKVLIVTKDKKDETNTRYAQGGIAAVWDMTHDSIEKHIQDTIVAGSGVNDENIVRMVVSEGPQRVKELIDLGAQFDKIDNEHYDLAREGGHTEKRILHHKDITGWEIERTLLEAVAKHPNIQILEHHFTIDIITQHHLGEIVTSQRTDIECYGAYVLNKKTNEILTILSKVTVIATGGIGQTYAVTTNPAIATGDGIAMFYRAKGLVKDMEFVQFHPTALYEGKSNTQSFLITEAIRGFGAILRNQKGEAFMEKYDERKELAPRDIVARAIDNELKISGDDFVYLDCRHLDRKEFINHFPNIYNKCMSIGIDPFVDMIPVAPAMHYLCGGIQVDKNGQSSIRRVYAIGECACTGLHGANRLASNSLLEALVFAHNAAVDSISKFEHHTIPENIPDWNAEGTTQPEEMILITQARKELQQTMSSYVGIVRSNVRLKRAWDRLELLYQENEALYEKTTINQAICELRNMICIGYLITKHAMRRKKSIGLHYVVG